MVVRGRITGVMREGRGPHEASGAEDGSALGVIVDPPDHPVQVGAGTARQVKVNLRLTLARAVSGLSARLRGLGPELRFSRLDGVGHLGWFGPVGVSAVFYLTLDEIDLVDD